MQNEIIKLLKKVDTPFLYLDLEKVKENYQRLKASLKKSQIFYAVKANSERRIVRELVKLGSSFDIASKNELDLVLEEGGTPKKISFGNTIKKEKDIKYAYEKGVEVFVADEFAELEKIAKNAPKSKVFIRIAMTNSDSDWPLTKKFGCDIEKAKQILLYSKKLDLEPFGVSFHVGSQCYDKYAWKNMLLQVKEIFDFLKNNGINLKFINTGGGMPIKHMREIPQMEEICKVINEAIEKNFSEYNDLIIASEPGRSMVGDAGIMATTIILKSEKDKKEWLYIDAGVFHGLMETIEGFKYEITSSKKGIKKSFTLSGPTCDSVDTMYDEVRLENDLEIGDNLFFLNAGAYTIGYASYFNGIEPPKVYFRGDEE